MTLNQYVVEGAINLAREGAAVVFVLGGESHRTQIFEILNWRFPRSDHPYTTRGRQAISFPVTGGSLHLVKDTGQDMHGLRADRIFATKDSCPKCHFDQKTLYHSVLVPGGYVEWF